VATISINTSGLADNMKPQVLQALNKVINDPVIRGQINSRSEFKHGGLVLGGIPTGWRADTVLSPRTCFSIVAQSAGKAKESHEH
jgi:hypothetical protein